MRSELTAVTMRLDVYACLPSLPTVLRRDNRGSDDRGGVTVVPAAAVSVGGICLRGVVVYFSLWLVVSLFC